MPLSAAAVAYSAVGGLVLYSGVKGVTLTDMAKDVLAGKLPTTGTETISTASSSTATSSSSATSSSTSNQALAQSLATSMGYSDWTTGTPWSDWVDLWNQESGWSATANNPTSGAYGIPQALPATKMPTAAQAPPSGTSDPTAQITWGIDYIASTYGSPVMAWAHEQANGWY